MRKPLLRLYGPFIALALAQALFIAVAPSTSPGQDVAFEPGDYAAPDDVGEELAAGDVPGGEPAVGDGIEAGTPAQQSGGTAGTPGTTGGGQSPAGRQDGSATPVGDTSHCVDGRQHGKYYQAPPCVPKWSGDNGGATAPGVTGDTIKIYFYREKKNEVVAAILQQEGLHRSDAEEEDFAEAMQDFLNAHYEFYGRKIDIQVRYGDCPETPPDVPLCKAEAREIAKERPFMVLWPVPLYPDIFDEFYKLGVIAIGGWHFDERYFTQRRPYRYDVFMDGTRTADIAAEYYCKKMARRNASHSGPVIHPTIGARDQVPRRMGIITPENPAFLEAAKRLQQLVTACDAQAPVLVSYESNIERSQTQANANISALIDGKVTTVVCMCDPIAPVFRTQTATRQGYFPEHLLSGSGLLDYDKLGRLYEPSQWAHAFGPSHLQTSPVFEQTEAAVVWRESGRPGNPCLACNLPWAYYNLAAALIQGAGPNLNAATVARAADEFPPTGGWQQTGGRPEVVLSDMGPGDYTAVSDIKEVYWSPTAPSNIDRRAGAYVPLRGGRRYRAGELDSTFEIPVPTD
ncbi:MAG TPA: hypothetical protein VNU01_07035 [Egibacteraceae bacterium]|nr:hypothetical protein [Egibacteraceae bacterium]